jgi:hypothetical protein
MASDISHPNGPKPVGTSSPPPKKTQKNKEQKKTQAKKKKTTDRLPSFFRLFPVGPYARRLWTCCHMPPPPHVGTRSWLWGLPLRAKSPLMTPVWCLCETFFLCRHFFLSNGHSFYFLRKTN